MPLVITRKQDQGFVIGEGIVVTAVSCVKGRVKLSIDAPADVVVRRAELLAADVLQLEERSESHHEAAMKEIMALARQWKRHASRNDDVLANSTLDDITAVLADVRA